MQLEHNDAGEPKWKMIEDRKFVPDDNSPTGGHWTPVKMATGEELNAAKLDEMMTALDDLKIVDVSRKPAGLSTDLKAAADFKNHRESVESLAQKGFFAAELTKGQRFAFIRGVPRLMGSPYEFQRCGRSGAEVSELLPHLQKVVDEIEAELYSQGKSEVPSTLIGDLVMSKLKELDYIAYIRFASVYREFADIKALKEAVDNLVVTQKTHLPGQLVLIPETKPDNSIPHKM